MHEKYQPKSLTLQFLFHGASRRHRESTDKVTKLHQAIFIDIKAIEDVAGKLARIPKGEKLMIDLAKFLKKFMNAHKKQQMCGAWKYYDINFVVNLHTSLLMVPDGQSLMNPRYLCQ